MQLESEATAEAIRRLRRVEGQVAGVVRMLDEGRSCKEIVTQLSAASKALDRAAFNLVASGMKQCLSEPDGDVDQAEMMRLLMTLA